MSDKRPTRFTRNKTEDISNLLYGKIPPQARELEEAVLGAMLIEKDAVEEVADILKPENFYVDAHATIYRVMLDLFNNSNPVDMLTVAQALRKEGKLEECGGAYYLSELTNKVASAANIKYHARIVAQKFIARELIHVSNDVIRDSYEETTDIFELHASSVKRMEDVVNFISKDTDHVKSAVIDVLSQDHEAIARSKVKTGYREHDLYYGPFDGGELIIIAARPSVGKTALAINLAKNASINFGLPTALFSLEMSNKSLATRMISMESGVAIKDIKNGTMSPSMRAEVNKYADKLISAPIYMDDTAGLNVMEFKAKARRLKKKNGIRLIVIDYLQLMKSGESKSQNREQEISYISRELKVIAKELSIPIVALSQLNRSVESRGGEKKPNLSDLRESGSIEQDSDRVYFLYRPEYYGITQTSGGESTEGLTEIIVAKNREGATGHFLLHFDKETNNFTDLNDMTQEDTKKITYNPGADKDDEAPF